MKQWRSAVALAMVVSACLTSPAWAADRVSGVLTSTYVIVEDTDLAGDVRCDVPNGTACFSFGASGVELRLNGFTIAGKADAITGCAGTNGPNEFGITTNAMNRVSVRGPGVVKQFRADGIFVIGSTDSRVVDLTLSTNCMSGIRIAATSFGTLVENNMSVRNGASNPGLSCGGI
jgi:parallel beta-helix repeat protein